MQVDGQRVHYHDFARICTHKSLCLFRQELVIGHPWILRMEMPLDAKVGPVQQFLFDI